VVVCGWSHGQFTAIQLASRYLRRVAGIAPNCANWAYSNIEAASQSNEAPLAVDGWGAPAASRAAG